MKIPLYKILTDDEDTNTVSKVIKRGGSWANGPEVEEFEREISKYVGSDYCLTFNSGTSALHAILSAYKIGMGNEVIVPSFTFIATSNSVLFVNAKPVFADIEDRSYGIDLDDVRKKINKNTRAILPVHFGGMPCDVLELKEIAESNKVLLIEDAAEAMGAKIKGKNVGNIGDSSILSFCGNKILTTGEGGAVLTNSKDTYEKLKLIRSHGRDEKQNYFTTSETPDYIELGYNWRISSITAALGLSQLHKLDKIIDLRRRNANRLSGILSKFKWLKTPTELQDRSNVYQFYTILVENNAMREKLRIFLSEKDITCKVYFEPVHKTRFYAEKMKNVDVLPVTETISRKVLSLPMYPTMTNEEMSYIEEIISEFANTNNI